MNINNVNANKSSDFLDEVINEPVNRRGFLKKIFFLGSFIALTPLVKFCKNSSSDNFNNKKHEPTLYDIPEKDGEALNYPGENLIVIKSKNKIYALSNICPHNGCIVNYENNEKKFICPCHQSIFNTNGSKINGPSPRGLNRYELTLESSSKLRIDTSKQYKENDNKYINLFIKV